MAHMIAAAAALSVLVGASLPAAASDDPLARHRWSDRVIVALAASAGDPSLAEQRRLVAAMSDGAHERDLVLLAAIDGTPEGTALRRRFGGTGFRAVLVGKDGGAKLSADHPLDAATLFPLIDVMPMRQHEMRRTK